MGNKLYSQDAGFFTRENAGIDTSLFHKWNNNCYNYYSVLLIKW